MSFLRSDTQGPVRVAAQPAYYFQGTTHLIPLNLLAFTGRGCAYVVLQLFPVRYRWCRPILLHSVMLHQDPRDDSTEAFIGPTVHILCLTNLLLLPILCAAGQLHLPTAWLVGATWTQSCMVRGSLALPVSSAQLLHAGRAARGASRQCQGAAWTHQVRGSTDNFTDIIPGPGCCCPTYNGCCVAGCIDCRWSQPPRTWHQPV